MNNSIETKYFNFKQKTQNQTERQQRVKEPTRLMNYLGERQEILTSQLPNKRTSFIQESQKDILLQKLRSVNSIMMNLIQSGNKTSGQLNVEENLKLLDMLQGKLQHKVNERKGKTQRTKKQKHSLSSSLQKIIQRIKNKQHIKDQNHNESFLQSRFSKSTIINNKQESQTQPLIGLRKKLSDFLKVQETFQQNKLSRSHNYLRNKGNK